jgi:hypothetical protein
MPMRLIFTVNFLVQKKNCNVGPSAKNKKKLVTVENVAKLNCCLRFGKFSFYVKKTNISCCEKSVSLCGLVTNFC